MKALGIVFSARKEGNCLKCVSYCVDKFKERGLETEIINAFELEIKPCSHCDYECSSEKECPVEDDVPEIWRRIEDADIRVFGIPTYGGHLSSLYFAFAQRMPMEKFKSFRECVDKVLRGTNFLIIGNVGAGGEMALQEACHNYNCVNIDFWPETLLLSAGEYDRVSFDGDLIEVPEVKKRLDRFVERILKRWTE